MLRAAPPRHLPLLLCLQLAPPLLPQHLLLLLRLLGQEGGGAWRPLFCCRSCPQLHRRLLLLLGRVAVLLTALHLLRCPLLLPSLWWLCVLLLQSHPGALRRLPLPLRPHCLRVQQLRLAVESAFLLLLQRAASVASTAACAIREVAEGTATVLSAVMVTAVASVGMARAVLSAACSCLLGSLAHVLARIRCGKMSSRFPLTSLAGRPPPRVR